MVGFPRELTPQAAAAELQQLVLTVHLQLEETAALV
jgi:hypothetical protein